MAVSMSMKDRLSNGHQKKPLKEGDFNLLFNELNDIVANGIMSRQQWLSNLFDPRRNLNHECGYPDNPGPSEFRQLYDRDPIAARVVEVMPLESWKVTPSVYEDEDSDKITDFEEAWDGLAKSLRGQSWYKDEEGSPIWEALVRADILSGIGSYGVLLLGIDDGLPMQEPAKGVEEANSFPIEKVTDSDSKAASLKYPNGEWGGPVYNLTINKKATKGRSLVRLMPFDEISAQVTQWETNRTSPRYGMPVMYMINFNDPSENSVGGIGMPMSTENVHWTRVIHVADTSGQGCSSDLVVPPRLRSVLNAVLDTAKLRGGSAEMYWRGAFPGLSAETHPQLGGDVQVDVATTQDQMEQYMNTLQRYLITSGMSVKTLSPTVVDPKAQIEVQIEAICIKIAVPIPVFKGYEIGEQASSNNDQSWNDRLTGRQNNYITPRMIVPFVDRLIMMGVLPEPSEGYHIKWPDLDAISDMDQATIANTRTTALSAYVQGGCEAIMAPMDFYTRILDMTDEEATSVLEAVQEHLEESYPDTEDTTTPGAVPSAPPPELPPGAPIKMKEGESLVGPGGEKLPAKTITAANQVDNVFCPTGEGGGVDSSCGNNATKVETKVFKKGLENAETIPILSEEGLQELEDSGDYDVEVYEGAMGSEDHILNPLNPKGTPLGQLGEYDSFQQEAFHPASAYKGKREIEVTLGDLRSGQLGVSREVMTKHSKTKGLEKSNLGEVVKMGDKYIVGDGNNRLSILKLSNFSDSYKVKVTEKYKKGDI